MAEQTVKVRVAVRVHPSGGWYAYSYSGHDIESVEDVLADMSPDEPGDGTLFWLTADLPLPNEFEVAARAEGEE